MANKRIKISELPKIGYNQTSDLTVTKNDYMPIAVTNKVDLTVKTSMAITTRELQRFVLQQDENLADETNTLTIGRSSSAGSVFTIKMDTVEVANTLRVTGKCIFEGDVNMASITLDTGNFNSDIRVGSAVYPALFRNSAGTATVPYGLLVADSNGKLQGHSTSFASLASVAPITIAANRGRVVVVGNDGKLSFSTSSKSLLQGDESLTDTQSLFGNVLAVSNTGGIEPDTDLKISALNNAVTSATKVLDPTTVTNSQNHKFITTSNSAPSLNNFEYHNSANLNVKTVSDTVAAAAGPFPDNVSGGRLLGTNQTSAGLDDVQKIQAKHIQVLTNAIAAGDAADNLDGIDSRGGYRTVFGAPIVLGGKHMDEVDLTDSTYNYAADNKIGPRDFAACIGEMRWNLYNGVPTIYLAVKRMGTEVSGIKNARACHWYGVPLFGTIDLETSPLTGSYDNLD